MLCKISMRQKNNAEFNQVLYFTDKIGGLVMKSFTLVSVDLKHDTGKHFNWHLYNSHNGLYAAFCIKWSDHCK